MEIEYLKNFKNRMEKIGAYALLFQNSIPKGTWKRYGYTQFYEQTNLLFAVLLFIMEQSLKEEICTMDDVGGFIDSVNMQWFRKSLSYDECRELGDFIINVILCDEGKAMYFKGFDFVKGTYEDIHINFIHNKIVYTEDGIKRTSYYLTDEGYQLMLSTLEIESNMMLTIHEMIFRLHLEKASYEQAVDDIKNIFNQLRMQLYKIQETMQKIRQNALLYSVQDYKTILEDNLNLIESTKKKFYEYREHVRQRVLELEEKDINIRKLELKEEKNLKNLKIIETYLNRAIDEHQKILSSHFDLKTLYTKELEDLSQMSLIKRFQLRSELYEKVLEDADILENIHFFLSPLFGQDLYKTYNLNKSLEVQKPIKAKQMDDEEQVFHVEDDDWKEETKRLWQDKLSKYKSCLSIIISYAFQHKEISLSEIKEKLTEEERNKLIPSVEIFKETVVELLKYKIIDIPLLKKEQENYIEDNTMTFQINLCSLELVKDHKEWRGIQSISAWRKNEAQEVVFEHVKSDLGMVKRIRCSDITITVE